MIVSTNVEDSYNIIVLFLYTTVQQDLTNAEKSLFLCATRPPADLEITDVVVFHLCFQLDPKHQKCVFTFIITHKQSGYYILLSKSRTYEMKVKLLCCWINGSLMSELVLIFNTDLFLKSGKNSCWCDLWLFGSAMKLYLKNKPFI